MRHKTVTGVGSHPELGDVVYAGEVEIGPIEFFYYRVSATEWAVKITGHETDPVEVQLKDMVNDDGQPNGTRALFLVGPATGKNIYNGRSALGPGPVAVRVQNNQPEAPAA